MLNGLGGWPVLLGDKWDADHFNWQNIIAKFREKGVSADYFITVDISGDYNNGTRKIISVRDVDEMIFGNYSFWNNLNHEFDNTSPIFNCYQKRKSVINTFVAMLILN